MKRPAIDTPFTAAVFAIIVTTAAGVLAALYPSDANPWVAPVIAGLTAMAALVRLNFKAPQVP